MPLKLWASYTAIPIAPILLYVLMDRIIARLESQEEQIAQKEIK